jgi:hypothetical protein
VCDNQFATHVEILNFLLGVRGYINFLYLKFPVDHFVLAVVDKGPEIVA